MYVLKIYHAIHIYNSTKFYVYPTELKLKRYLQCSYMRCISDMITI